jgi:uncharacterized repeat protein (TIGR03803 family)
LLEKSPLRKKCVILVLLVFSALLGAGWAQTESVLYSFCARYEDCHDGANPYAGLIFDKKGNLYGTTMDGGAYGGGGVFKLSAKGKETVLYSFCAQNDCADGGVPQAGLIFDQKGNLYGTTSAGGLYSENCLYGDCGIVFELTPEGEETVLYSFCAQSGCTDGERPTAALVFDGNGNLYGTTYGGGAFNGCGSDYGCGVVFELTPQGEETVPYSFCAQNNCTDGAYPYAGVVFDQKGNLYGTTVSGGAYCGSNYGCGVVFKLTPQGEETVLYSFCAKTTCADGASPYGGLVFDKKGNLYGTTLMGGAANRGTVFKLTPEGEETVLYSFCAKKSYCHDGENPYAGVVFDQKGNLYGTTPLGGAYDGCDNTGCGVVFELTPKGKETVLHSFCAQKGCDDGSLPYAGLVFDTKGNLYGTTWAGGSRNYHCAYHPDMCGVVFKLTP